MPAQVAKSTAGRLEYSNSSYSHTQSSRTTSSSYRESTRGQTRSLENTGHSGGSKKLLEQRSEKNGSRNRALKSSTDGKFLSSEFADYNNNSFSEYSNDSVFSDVQVYKDEVKEYSSSSHFEELSSSKNFIEEVKSVKSPAARRKSFDTHKDGFRKVSVKSGHNEVNHYAKVDSSDDEDWIDQVQNDFAGKRSTDRNYKRKDLVQEDEIIVKDESNYIHSGERSLEEVMEQHAKNDAKRKQKSNFNRQLVQEDEIIVKDESNYIHSGERSLDEVMNQYERKGRKNQTNSNSSTQSKDAWQKPVQVQISMKDDQGNDHYYKKSSMSGGDQFGNQSVYQEEEYYRKVERPSYKANNPDHYEVGSHVEYTFKMDAQREQTRSPNKGGYNVSFDNHGFAPVHVKVRPESPIERKPVHVHNNSQRTNTKQNNVATEKPLQPVQVLIRSGDEHQRQKPIKIVVQSESDSDDEYANTYGKHNKSKTRIYTEDVEQRQKLAQEEQRKRWEREQSRQEHNRREEERYREELYRRQQEKIKEQLMREELERQKRKEEERIYQERIKREKAIEEEKRFRKEEKERQRQAAVEQEKYRRWQIDQEVHREEERKEQEELHISKQRDTNVKTQNMQEFQRKEALNKNRYDANRETIRKESVNNVKSTFESEKHGSSHIDVNLSKGRNIRKYSENDVQRSRTQSSQSDHSHHEHPVHVVVSPGQRTKAFHPVTLPVDITVTREDDQLLGAGINDERYKVVVSPVPRVTGFVPVSYQNDVQDGKTAHSYPVKVQNPIPIYQNTMNSKVTTDEKFFAQGEDRFRKMQEHEALARHEQDRKESERRRAQERRREQEIQRMENARIERLRYDQSNSEQFNQRNVQTIQRRHSMQTKNERNHQVLNISSVHETGSKTLPRNLRVAQQYVDSRMLGTASVSNTPNMSQNRRFVQGAVYETKSAQNINSASQKHRMKSGRRASAGATNATLTSASSYQDETVFKGSATQIKRRLSNPNIILGRTEIKDRTTLRPTSADITKQNPMRHTLPRNFSRAKSQEFYDKEVETANTNYYMNTSASYSHIDSSTQHSASSAKPRHLQSQQQKRQRAKSATEIDEYRMAEAQQKYLQKIESQKREEAFRASKESQEKGQLGKDSSDGGMLNIISGSHVGKTNSLDRKKIQKVMSEQQYAESSEKRSETQTIKMTHTAYKTKLLQERGEATTGYEPPPKPARGIETRKEVTQKAPYEQVKSGNEKYEQVKVFARGGIIQLSMEEKDEALPYHPPTQYPDPYKRPEAKMTAHAYHKSRSSQANESKSWTSHQEQQTRVQQTRNKSDTLPAGIQRVTNQQYVQCYMEPPVYLNQDYVVSENQHRGFYKGYKKNSGYYDYSHNYRDKYGNILYVDQTEIGNSQITQVREDNLRVQPETVYYTVCTHYFQPEKNDWILNIHRQGKVQVPAGMPHRDQCVFVNHLYQPDKEDIIVEKVVPPAVEPAQDISRQQQYLYPVVRQSDTESVDSRKSSLSNHSAQQFTSMRKQRKFDDFLQQQQQQQKWKDTNHHYRESSNPQNHYVQGWEVKSNQTISNGDQVFDSTHQALMRRRRNHSSSEAVQSRSFDESTRQRYGSMNDSFHSDEYSSQSMPRRPGSAGSNRSDSSRKRSKARLLRKSREMPGVGNQTQQMQSSHPGGFYRMQGNPVGAY